MQQAPPGRPVPEGCGDTPAKLRNVNQGTNVENRPGHFTHNPERAMKERCQKPQGTFEDVKVKDHPIRLTIQAANVTPLTGVRREK